MRLESALFSSREGLISHGQAISVVGDNVSNANTVGYKSNRVEFEDLVPGGAQAGNLPTTGSGSRVGRVRPILDTGVIETTGRALDVGIGGKGFFMVGSVEAPQYSRAGNFQIGSDGLLKTADGENVLGYSGTDTTTLGNINTRNLNVVAEPTTAATVFANVDSRSSETAAPLEPDSFNEVASLASFVTAIDVFDSLGESHDLSIAFFKTAPGAFTAQAYIDGGDVGGIKGVPTKVGAEIALSFDENGGITEASRAAAIINAAPAYSNSAAVGAFTIDLSNISQYSGTNQVSGVIRDGRYTGTISEYEFRSDGSLFAKLDTGQTLQVGTLPLANFINPDGLERGGQNRFIAGDAAGERSITLPGALGVAEIAPSSLERSTVDLANQFIDLVLYQRGYQASSQTLNAANNLLRDTIGLIR